MWSGRKKLKVGFLYSATATSRALQSQEVAVDWHEPMVPAAQTAAIQLHALMYNLTRAACSQQTHHRSSQPHQAFTRSIHQMAPPVRGNRHPITAYYSFIDLEG